MPSLAVVIAAVAIAAAVLALWLAARWRAFRRSRIAIVRAARAGVGEDAAVTLLLAGGYAVVARQARHVWAIIVDGVPRRFELRADYLVERGGERLVAEVKTGDAAPRLETAATRRQLLEYRVAFAVDAVLLVCPELGLVQRVDFPISGSLPAGKNLPALAPGSTLDA